eukprot:2928472-Prorocentrum_lima.AAC.1
MTSSLVGSEMCIRDRHKDEPMGVYQDGLLAHIVGLLRSQLSVPHENIEGCLLYTSDAADDM